MSDKQHSTFVQDLRERRFFQYVGTYLGISFGLVQRAEFVEGRYGLENNLVEKMLLFVAIMFPAVVVFVFNHGRKGDNQPVLLLEVARIAQGKNDLSKANDLLARTLAIRQNAESTYRHFREALELRSQLAIEN